MTVADLPALNAALNSIATVFLVVGWLCIRARRIAWHRASMLAAFATSTAFLVSYLIYHFQVPTTSFRGTGAIRYVYYVILLTHVLLAMTIPPLALITLWRALASRFDKHRRIARITLPIWLYVSVTGVIVYVMLYRL